MYVRIIGCGKKRLIYLYVTHNAMFSPNLNSVQLKCKWLDSHNYLYNVRGCGAMGDKISVYKHHKSTQSSCTNLYALDY